MYAQVDDIYDLKNYWVSHTVTTIEKTKLFTSDIRPLEWMQTDSQ